MQQVRIDRYASTSWTRTWHDGANNNGESFTRTPRKNFVSAGHSPNFAHDDKEGIYASPVITILFIGNW